MVLKSDWETGDQWAPSIANDVATVLNSAVQTGGALGTPSGGTLTNCTGLPVAGLVASASTAVGVGSIELGHATDTTVTRASAGVIAVEGAPVLTLKETSTVAEAGTTTLTNVSTPIQVFTGSTTQTMLLPTTGVLAGQAFTVINNSTGVVTVQSSAANSIYGLTQNRGAIFFARIDTPTAGADWIIGALSSSTSASVNTTAVRDANANMTADAFISSRTSTATAAGTTTLTIDSTQVQIFTGSTTQTVLLPTTSVVAGQTYTVINNSTGMVTVQSSGANTLTGGGLPNNRIGVWIARIDTPTAATDWHLLEATAATAASIDTMAFRDGSGNLSSDAFIPGFTATATAGATTTLTADSTEIQQFTGTLAQTCALPTTTIVAGQRYTVINSSTQSVTVTASGGATISTLTAGLSGTFVALQATPTLPAHWAKVS